MALTIYGCKWTSYWPSEAFFEEDPGNGQHFRFAFVGAEKAPPPGVTVTLTVNDSLGGSASVSHEIVFVVP